MLNWVFIWFRLPLPMISALFFLKFLPISAYALVGETESECIARYGNPVEKSDQALIFRKNNRILEIRFQDGRAAFITCRDAPEMVETFTEIPAFRSEIPVYADGPRFYGDTWTFANAPLKFLSFLWGTAEPSALYLGMWSTHLTDPDLDIANNWLIGLNFRGYFLGTFINSYDKRSWALGIERRILSFGKQNRLNASLGYRLGLMTGYEDRFTPFF